MYQVQISCIHTQSGVYGLTKDTWTDVGAAQETMKHAKEVMDFYYKSTPEHRQLRRLTKGKNLS